MPDRPPHDEDDDDFELELEPVDADVLEIERQRGQRKTDEAITKATVDELYQDRGHAELDVDWSKLRQFRFTIQHLLILTAILAVGLTLQKMLGNCGVVIVAVLIALGIGWHAVLRAERREAAARARRREEFFATRGASGEAATTEVPPLETPEPRKLSDFKFAFSLKQLFITMTIAAVVVALLTIIGPKVVTIALGAIALVGIAVQVFGLFDPPPIVVLGWWLLLMMYLGLGLLAWFFPSLMAFTP
jgi:hypothetical protein